MPSNAAANLRLPFACSSAWMICFFSMSFKASEASSAIGISSNSNVSAVTVSPSVCSTAMRTTRFFLSLKNYPNGFSVSLSSGLVVVPPPVEDFTLPLSILNSTALAASRIFCLGVKTIFGVFSASFTVTSAAESIIVSSALTRVSDTVRHGYLILFVKGHCDCSVRLPLASYTNT